MRLQEPRWTRFAKAAVGGAGPAAAKSRRERWRGQVQEVHRRLAQARTGQMGAVDRRRADVRLLPAVVATWVTAAVAISGPLESILRAELAFGGILAATAVAVLCRRYARRRLHQYECQRAGRRAGRRVGPRVGQRPAVGGPGWKRDPPMRPRFGPVMLLATACVLAMLVAVGLRLYSSATSPLQLAVAQGGDFALTLEVKTVPRLLDSPNGPPRLIFDASVLSATAKGRVLTGRMPIRVLASPAWAGMQLGDRASTSGTVSRAGPRETIAGFLHPSTAPMSVSAATDGPQGIVIAIRGAWICAVHTMWDSHSPDTAGLLPGMVMGDRSGMNSELNESMKTVGLTHLTAVSGANCTLVLASLMLVLRSLRAPRPVAFVVSAAGLLGFVVLVGPDPSVLRAAVMGGIGAMAILGGRPKRTGALLSLSIVVLLLADPWLSVDYAFILSVLATLGLHLVGQRCIRWLAVIVPMWLAQAIAIPLAAQMFCAPVIVLLQARLTPYTVPANMVAAPVVALVTTVGTFGMVVAAVVPPLAALCAAVSGAGAWWVAVVAKSMSALPAASLPWPEGVSGVVLMSCMNAAVLLGLCAVVEQPRVSAVATRIAGLLPQEWRRRYGFSAVVILASTASLWWTCALLWL